MINDSDQYIEVQKLTHAYVTKRQELTKKFAELLIQLQALKDDFFVENYEDIKDLGDITNKIKKWVKENGSIFKKPKTAIVNNIRIGFKKPRPKIIFNDNLTNADIIKAIEDILPEEIVNRLIHTKKTLWKDRIPSTLTHDMMEQIGISVPEITEDEVVFKYGPQDDLNDLIKMMRAK